MSEPEFWWGLGIFLDWVHSGNDVRGERFDPSGGFLDAVLDRKEKGDVAELQDFELTEDEEDEVEEHELEDYRKGLEQIQLVFEDAIDGAVTIIGESLTSANTTELAQFVLKYTM
ncbi:hypothetical protein BDZ45DRAFT_751708 [Acephala macrosclerotiorum]|nr:hypothetical protein BDZ45DRAFT_751708 [Acephala macrosclerotiorum]